jgi:peptidyl-prolyl cis-trans isomerase C
MRNLLSATALAGFVLSGAAFAQTAEPPAAAAYDAGTVLATVNGTDITLGHLILMLARLPQQIQGAPDEQLFPGLVEQLVDQTLLAEKASADGAEDPLEVRLLLENERRAALAMTSIRKGVEGPVEEAELQAAYDAAFADFEPETEYKASHILVETEERAAELMAEIEGGADFAETARTSSVGPSAPSGGDLGWFGPGQMVPAFDEAVQAMQPGTVAGPVETQFGWHLIQLAETRMSEAPTLDAIRAELEDQVRQQRLRDELAALRAEAEIVMPEVDVPPAAIRETDLVAPE